MKRIALLCLPVLAGCTLGPDFSPPQAEAPAVYNAPGDTALPADQTLHLGAAPDPEWWKSFRVPALDALMDETLQHNPGLTAAGARIAQAEEGRIAAEASLYPQLTLQGQTGAQNYALSQHAPLSITLPPFEYYAAGPALSFPLDLFGGGKRAVEQAAAFADYQSHARDAALSALIANLAAGSIRMAGARAQIADLKTVIAGDERDVDLVQSALDAGSATRTQLLSVQSQLAADRTLLPDLSRQEAAARHAMAILAGQAPGGWNAPDFALSDFTLPGDIAASLPSELVHRRPDILAAEARLHMASAAIGVATANLYPEINLSAQWVLEALTPASLANGVISEWAVAASVSQKLLDGGKLSAERRAAIDAYQASLADYQETVLGAFRDIADDLQALANDAERVKAEEAAMESANQALELARASFAAGNSGVLDVIDAERRSAQARLGLSRARAQRLLDTVQLYAALGATPAAPSVPAPDPGKPCCKY